MKVGFTVTEGDKVIDIFEKAPERLDRSADRAAKMMAQMCVDRIHVRVRRQIDIAPNKPSAIRRKKTRDPRALIDSERYIKGIRAKRIREGAWGVHVKDLRLCLLGEFGSKHQVPRPHILPALRDVGQHIPPKVGRRIFYELFGR